MTTLIPIGRSLFGAAIVGFGALCLGYADFVHQLQPVHMFLSTSAPAYGPLAILTGLVLLAAGLAIAANVKVFPAAFALMTMFALGIGLLQVPSAFVEPSLLRSPWWIRTFETLALMGAATTLAALAGGQTRARWVHLGRVLFGVSLPVFGVLHFVYAENVASLVPVWYPWPRFWAYVTGMGNVAAGLAIATGVLSRPAAVLAGFMYGAYAVTLHVPLAWTLHGPHLFMEDAASLQIARGGLTSLCVAFGMWGAAWIVAGSMATAGVRESPRDAPGGVPLGAQA